MFAAIGGPTAVTAFALTAGDTATVMVRTETALNSAYPGDIRDTTVPQAWAAGLQSLMTGNRLDPRDRETLVGWMSGTRTSDKRFRADLPAGWTSADKTGTGDYGTANDGGLLIGPNGQRILLVIQTRESRFDADAAPADALIGSIAALVAGPSDGSGPVARRRSGLAHRLHRLWDLPEGAQGRRVCRRRRHDR